MDYFVESGGEAVFYQDDSKISIGSNTQDVLFSISKDDFNQTAQNKWQFLHESFKNTDGQSGFICAINANVENRKRNQ